MQSDQSTGRIIGCGFAVHQELGPGFPENIYQNALEQALEADRIPFIGEKAFRVGFRGAPVGSFKVDLLVEDRVVVEVKAITGMLPKVFEAQVVAYLKATGLPVGLLVNFGNMSCQVRRLVLRSRTNHRNHAVKSP